MSREQPSPCVQATQLANLDTSTEASEASDVGSSPTPFTATSEFVTPTGTPLGTPRLQQQHVNIRELPSKPGKGASKGTAFAGPSLLNCWCGPSKHHRRSGSDHLLE